MFVAKQYTNVGGDTPVSAIENKIAVRQEAKHMMEAQNWWDLFVAYAEIMGIEISGLLF
jgi:hypothetical protein